ncbi:Uma2 family endonuclease [Leptodesmis sichuanensis]|uniref:Uma2 family endonuclease n=1 Tax=Leptodesmis sichuanensis TaxID=2906798 RepID=UPI001F3C97F2|nr:Uma2 family endonuclease [Leptodesmis sichuanensis]UIE39845.1 Uma2 family endonuclease [Leptodesmis sichuanensis A121]
MVVTLDLRPILELTDEQFEQICRSNPDLKFERTAKGELVVVALTGGETGRRNIKLSARLETWSDAAGLGVAFDSSTGFRLPNGAIRSPDAAWICLERWESLTPEQRKKIVPLCPDFLVELRSPNDELEDLQAKMQEYLANGLKLGWLLDPDTQTVEIYRPDRAVEVLTNPTHLSGEDVLPGFCLNLTGILA